MNTSNLNDETIKITLRKEDIDFSEKNQDAIKYIIKLM